MPASGSPGPGLTQTTTSASEVAGSEDRPGPSHGMDNPPHHHGQQGTRDMGHTTGDTRAYHLSQPDPDPATQQIIQVLPQFGEQQVSTVLNSKMTLFIVHRSMNQSWIIMIK